MLFESRGQHGKDKKVLIVMLEGGIGDHFLATPMLRVLRQTYPVNEWYFILIAMYHEVFGITDPITNQIIPINPNIDALYSMRFVSDFYSKWARQADKIFRANPYIQSPHRFGSKHLAEVWCELHDVKLDELQIDFFTTEFEKLKSAKFYQKFDCPVVVIQPYGAFDPTESIKTTTNKDWDDTRWQFVIDWLVNRGYEVIQIGKIGEHVFNKVFSLVGHTDIREVAVIAQCMDFFISIDSFLMHCAKAFDKIGIVLWGRTNPFRLGYVDNYNLFKLHSCPELFCGRPEGVLFDVAFNQIHFTPWECPHRNCMNAITVQDVCKGIGVIEQNLELDPAKYIRIPCF